MSKSSTGLKLGLVLAFGLFTSFLAQASNFHEHISTVPRYEDFQYAFTKIGVDPLDLQMKQISKAPANTLVDLFGRAVFQ